MAGRSDAVGWPERPAGVHDQIERIDQGSLTAADRLAQAVAAGLAADTPERRDQALDLVDAVAARAAAGSGPALHLLLSLVDEHNLTGPALSRLPGDTEQRAEIGQEVLAAVARSIGRYRSEARFTTWLYAVTRNVAVSKLRRRTVDTTELGPDEVLTSDSRRMSSLLAERKAVREAIGTLSPAQREVVVLRDLEGLSYVEIAERLDLAVNTVRTRLFRGRAQLTAELAQLPR
ncbi:MAG: sigma-70 family RNA polymerase sigma factor [Actinomycetota bacterium]